MSRPDINFITGQFVRRCRHRIDKHFADYMTLQYMSAGSVALRVGDAEYALNGRNFWSAYPGPRVAFHASAPGGWWVHRYLAFRGPLVTRWMADGIFPVPPQPPPGNADYAPRFDEVMALAIQPGRWDAQRAAHKLESILIDLAEARDAAPEPPVWVKSVSQQLSRRITAPVDYDALSDQLGMSVRSLRRNFNLRLGTSPHQYVITHRVQAARDLLLRTDTPLKEIATRLGYSDVFYFGRQFKKVTGVSPARFRKSREG
ncbi:MAG: helix-turn-helix transcriptional regulator [Burkholderiales bacterium]|nr:helix-turn-helix transcriptional regulator [Phycisphaerae bacterium]